MYARRLVGAVEGSDVAADQETTLEQIRDLVDNYALMVVIPDGNRLKWQDLFKCGDVFTPFGQILVDRIRRFGEGQYMANRPPFCAVGVVDGEKIVRIEMYDGHDALDLVLDLRSPALVGKDLPRSFSHDPFAYDASAEEGRADSELRALGAPEDAVDAFRELRMVAHELSMLPCQTIEEHRRLYREVLIDLLSEGMDGRQALNDAEERLESRAVWLKAAYGGYDSRSRHAI